jgi:hypothetical protein
MLVKTDQDRQRRLDELQAPEIDRLLKQAAREGKGRTATYKLAKFGIEGDFALDGSEWGMEKL